VLTQRGLAWGVGFASQEVLPCRAQDHQHQLVTENAFGCSTRDGAGGGGRSDAINIHQHSSGGASVSFYGHSHIA